MPEQRRYAASDARLRAMYLLPVPRGGAPTLELYEDDPAPVFAVDWPTSLHSQWVPRLLDPSGIQSSLELPAASFGQVLLHGTIDDLAARHPELPPGRVAGLCFDLARLVLQPGGVVTGCCENASCVVRRRAGQRSSGGHHAATLGPAACRRALLAAGFADPEVFYLESGIGDARRLISVDGRASRRAFARELGASRAMLSTGGFVARRLAIFLGLPRILESTLFFWGRRPC